MVIRAATAVMAAVQRLISSDVALCTAISSMGRVRSVETTVRAAPPKREIDIATARDIFKGPNWRPIKAVTPQRVHSMNHANEPVSGGRKAVTNP